MRTLFMGTPDFAVPCLEMLTKRNDIEIIGVVSQPDRQKGRGYKLMPPPVKEFAINAGIDVYQPDSVKTEEFSALLKELNPELIVVIAYGRILPDFVLDFPKYGCINVHASLLPKYRGAAPIQWSVINGEKKTGVTTMLMDKGLDTGDMLVVKEIEILNEDTSGSMFEKLSELGSVALSETIDKINNNTLIRTPQNHNEMTYAPMISKEMSYIDFSLDAEKICCLIKGLNPAPGAKAYLDGKILKILSAVVSQNSKLREGEINVSSNCFEVGCGNLTSIKLVVIQPEGKKPMAAEDFLKGYKFNKEAYLCSSIQDI
ncbi:MAG: methionyl-tRNA formyltransferase [Clostridia bacterium]|nr:methionyl-tRNA formyltransferase [Clostridia bacterium]